MAGSQPSTCQFDELTFPLLRLKDNTLDENNLVSGCPLDKSRVYNTPQQDLGALQVLPLELLQVLLFQLDLRTLMDFRWVNHRALQVVDSIPEYKEITTHALNALRGILCIGTGRWITCEALYNTICTAECEECGDFAGYIYILTCKRVCFLCLSENKAYLPLRYSLAIRKFGITRQIIDMLPHMRSIPGTYSPNERKCRDRLSLVDPNSARQAGINFHGSTSAMERYVSDLAAQKLQKFNEKLLKAEVEGRRITARRPSSEDPFDGQPGNPLRFMAIVQAPTINRSSKEVEWGSYCVGCRESSDERPQHFRRRFTKASFAEHLKECGLIRDGKH